MRRSIIVLWAVAILLLPAQAFGTGMMERLAGKIVRSGDSHDTKMQKIEQWVQRNIQYVSDMELYGKNHAHYHPSVTIRNHKADCEDGALLIHSLAAYAGVPLERLRTVMGARDPQGLKSGHAWMLYRREEDRAWVVVDWTRSGNAGPMDQRPVLWLTPGYGRFWIKAYLTIQGLRPYRVGYVEIGGEARVSALGRPGELNRLLAAP
jgi:predicted transglutaminase-like cysteine proteinase